jgi:hypothetical protein
MLIQIAQNGSRTLQHELYSTQIAVLVLQHISYAWRPEFIRQLPPKEEVNTYLAHRRPHKGNYDGYAYCLPACDAVYKTRQIMEREMKETLNGVTPTRSLCCLALHRTMTSTNLHMIEWSGVNVIPNSKNLQYLMAMSTPQKFAQCEKYVNLYTIF